MALVRSPELCNEMSKAKHMTESQTAEIKKMQSLKCWKECPSIWPSALVF